MTTSSRIIIVSMALLLLLLQWTLWAGRSGVLDFVNLRHDIGEATARNDRLARRNQLLLEDVLDIKSREEAVEELARSRLGMIREGERFFQVIERPATVR